MSVHIFLDAKERKAGDEGRLRLRLMRYLLLATGFGIAAFHFCLLRFAF
jgi:hypothetical protein